MRLLFVHQNFPGQFLHLAPRLARAGHQVTALSKREEDVKLPGVKVVRYALPDKKAPGTRPLLQRFERARGYGEAAANSALRMKRDGFAPDVIVIHPGWGEGLFLKDVWPEARQLHYCEFHLTPFGPAQVHNPTMPPAMHQVFEARLSTGLNLFALETMDRGYSPTRWQHGQYPDHARDRIDIIHDGINARACRPNPDATVTLPSGRQLTRRDKVVTYVSRNLEPMRGFPEFMRAAELLLSRNQDVEVVVVGGDEVSYSRSHASGRPWREIMLDEVDVDPSRIHFLGKVPYGVYLSALQISAAHVYLTAPFLLSWSALEAMSAGCLLIASDTDPVREVVEDGENGLLFDFFDRRQLVSLVEDSLADPDKFESIRENARATILENYTVARCVPVQMDLVESLGAKRSK
ncbi:MAG: glycosyltransferase [Hyphomicrobiales bacterium]|nr:glycosyltransferase [Hyphomicrobiales bacterium]